MLPNHAPLVVAEQFALLEAARAGALARAKRRAEARLPASHNVPLGGGVTARVRIFGFGSGRFAADVVVPGRGAARVDATFATDGRLTALTESWRAESP